MRVLIVEDQKKIATFIRKALAEAGMIAEVCYNGEPFPIRVQETRGTETKSIARAEGHTAPYSGYAKKP